jgi:uncharacterized SAM-binding protein YcdF (DUF218 family)
MIRGFLISLILLALAYALGFALWVSALPSTPLVRPKVDGVVVLTGDRTRLNAGVALFEKGTGKRLLISGAGPSTSRDTLKELAHGGARFACCADIGYSAQDTSGNAVEAADWAHGHGFHSLAVVTARYHMPRALNEFRGRMPDVSLSPWPVDEENVNLSGWWRRPQTVKLLHREFIKYLASLAAALVRR